jgi:hypothetical protein
MGPGPKDDFVRRLQQVVTGPKANSKYETLRKRKPAVEPEDAQDQLPEQPQDQAPLQPSAPDADAEIDERAQDERAQDERAQDERAQDALKLLQELAQKNSGNEQTRPAPAPEPDATLATYLAAVDTVDDVNAARPLVRPLPPANAKLPPPAHSGAGRRVVRFAIAGCCAVLAAGMTGLFLWSQVVPAPDAAPPAKTEVIAATPAAPSNAPAQAEIPSSRTALAECDVPVRKDPYADYFLVGENAPGGNVRKTAEPSRGDSGWYSLMAAKARLDRRGGHC